MFDSRSTAVISFAADLNVIQITFTGDICHALFAGGM